MLLKDLFFCYFSYVSHFIWQSKFEGKLDRPLEEDVCKTIQKLG